jgi:hypothetical protein
VLCPACERQLEETTATCPGCGFSLSQADTQFGAVPLIQPRLTDLQGHLSKSNRTSLLKATLGFEQRFPSVPFTTLIHTAPEGTPCSPYLFWLFNRSSLHTALEKGGSNRLEPILPDSLIQDALTAARPLALAGQTTQATIAFIHQFDVGLVNLQSQLPTIFGWFPEGSWSALEDEVDRQDLEFADGILSY